MQRENFYKPKIVLGAGHVQFKIFPLIYIGLYSTTLGETILLDYVIRIILGAEVQFAPSKMTHSAVNNNQVI